MLKLSEWGDTEGKTEKGAVRRAASLNVVTGVSALKIFIGEMGERTDRRQSQSLDEVKMNCFKVMGNTYVNPWLIHFNVRQIPLQ